MTYIRANPHHHLELYYLSRVERHGILSEFKGCAPIKYTFEHGEQAKSMTDKHVVRGPDVNCEETTCSMLPYYLCTWSMR